VVSVKWLVLLAFVLIIGSLGSALVFMVKDRGKTNKTFQFLALRVGLSISLFSLIWLAYHMGWIQPTGIPIR
jgi:Protein of unknown function (DUF2909)